MTQTTLESDVIVVEADVGTEYEFMGGGATDNDMKRAYGVNVIPLVALFDGGVETGRLADYTSESELLDFLRKHPGFLKIDDA